MFGSGRTAFEEGRYDDALRNFEASYALSERAELLYNIAQCHDRLRHDRDALLAFERYLTAAPEAENRLAIEARLRVLRDAVAQAETGRQAPTAPRTFAVAQDNLLQKPTVSTVINVTGHTPR